MEAGHDEGLELAGGSQGGGPLVAPAHRCSLVEGAAQSVVAVGGPGRIGEPPVVDRVLDGGVEAGEVESPEVDLQSER